MIPKAGYYTPLLHVNSIEESMRFYSLLGFEAIDQMGERGRLGWARMHCEGGAIMFLRAEEPHPLKKSSRFCSPCTHRSFGTCEVRFAHSKRWSGLSVSSRNKISSGDSVYLWESGPRGGILAVAEVVEMPWIQPEPAAQVRFVRDTEKFAGDELRVKVRLRKRFDPAIPRSYLLARPELANLSILRCPRGTNFRVSRAEADILKSLVASHMTAPAVGNATQSERRVVFAEE